MRAALRAVSFALTVTLVAASSAALAAPFVVVQDDGSLAGNPFTTVLNETAAQNKVLELYGATGADLPEVLSVWTTFPLGGGPYGTYFDPLAFDVTGIGLDTYYPPDGTLTSPSPPLRSVLFHNDVTQLPARAALQNAPVAGFGRYLFLLELFHNWGPALHEPTGAESFTGFPFHWSYFLDGGGSIGGGNVWTDNGDGTFTTVAADPAKLAYSMLDLYVMGLATADEVKPFGLLEQAVTPATPVDPLWGGPYAAHSFPWFDAASAMTVTATRRAVTIDDVVAANGARVPAAGSGPETHTLGIVLVVGKDDDAASIAKKKADFADLAASLAPSFHDATRGRGTLDVVTNDVSGEGGGAGGSASSSTSSSSTAAGTGGAVPADAPASDSGCATAPGGGGAGWGLGLVLAALAAARRRR